MRMQNFPEVKWLNTKRPLTTNDLKGQVVLLHFFTYCCINCIHTMPDIELLKEKFKNESFMVIGVHCPKFNNERDIENIKSAIDRYNIDYPIIVDNEFLTWKSYGVRAWPTFILIGSDGEIMGMASGEGNMDVLEQSIILAIEQGKENNTIEEKRNFYSAEEFDNRLLHFPSKMVIDKKKKEMYISDTGNDRVLRIKFLSALKGKIIQGIGGRGSGNQDGELYQAKLNKPQGLFIDDEKLYICDTENHSIKIANFETQQIRTILGNGVKARWGDTRGDSLNSPWDIIRSGDSIFIAMAGSHQIWRMDVNTMKIRPFIGNGRENLVDGNSRKSQLAQPSGLSHDGRDLFFADAESSAIRKVNMNSGLVKTISGKGLFKYGFRDGRIEEALFQHPKGVYYENNILYVADTFNNAIRIINLNKKVAQTLITEKNPNLFRIDEDSIAKHIREPNDLYRFGSFLYIADTNNHLIRALDIKKRTLYDFEIV